MAYPSLLPLVADVCAKQVVVCDVDALVMYAVLHPRVDWKHGGQPLHGIWVIERAMEAMKERGVLLYVLCVHNMGRKQAWKDELGAWAFRMLLIRHLQRKQVELHHCEQVDSFLPQLTRLTSPVVMFFRHGTMLKAISAIQNENALLFASFGHRVAWLNHAQLWGSKGVRAWMIVDDVPSPPSSIVYKPFPFEESITVEEDIAVRACAHACKVLGDSALLGARSWMIHLGLIRSLSLHERSIDLVHSLSSTEEQEDTIAPPPPLAITDRGAWSSVEYAGEAGETGVGTDEVFPDPPPMTTSSNTKGGKQRAGTRAQLAMARGDLEAGLEDFYEQEAGAEYNDRWGEEERQKEDLALLQQKREARKKKRERRKQKEEKEKGVPEAWDDEESEEEEEDVVENWEDMLDSEEEAAQAEEEAAERLRLQREKEAKEQEEADQDALHRIMVTGERPPTSHIASSITPFVALVLHTLEEWMEQGQCSASVDLWDGRLLYAVGAYLIQHSGNVDIGNANATQLIQQLWKEMGWKGDLSVCETSRSANVDVPTLPLPWRLLPTRGFAQHYPPSLQSLRVSLAHPDVRHVVHHGREISRRLLGHPTALRKYTPMLPPAWQDARDEREEANPLLRRAYWRNFARQSFARFMRNFAASLEGTTVASSSTRFTRLKYRPEELRERLEYFKSGRMAMNDKTMKLLARDAWPAAPDVHWEIVLLYLERKAAAYRANHGEAARVALVKYLFTQVCDRHCMEHAQDMARVLEEVDLPDAAHLVMERQRIQQQQAEEVARLEALELQRIQREAEEKKKAEEAKVFVRPTKGGRKKRRDKKKPKPGSKADMERKKAEAQAKQMEPVSPSLLTTPPPSPVVVAPMDPTWKPPIQVASTETFAEYQLSCMGEELLHRVPEAMDPRVQGFSPDLWQRQVMDAVDHEESVLVTVPTSAGKTFISYYVVKKVLSEHVSGKNPKDRSRGGVVVYVLPTKALCNQVAAEIHKAFGPEHYGILTSDYRINELNCRVLITVPSCLEMVLMSPIHRVGSCDVRHRDWVRRLRYVVLDEIHTIASSDYGAMLERVIQLIPCPFLALSATVGNPNALLGWLQRVRTQAASGAGGLGSQRVLHVHEDRRFAELRASFFVPPVKSVPFLPVVLSKDQVLEEDVGSLVEVHPLSAVTKFLPALRNLAMEPRDVLQVYHVMTQYGVVPAALAPDVYFEQDTLGQLIFRDRVYEWWDALLQVLCAWSISSSDKAQHAAEDVLATLQEPIQAVIQQEKRMPFAYLQSHIPELLANLSSRQQLPAILFHLDNVGCVRLARSLIDYLEREEQRWQRDHPVVVNESRTKWMQYEAMRKRYDTGLQRAQREGREVLQSYMELNPQPTPPLCPNPDVLEEIWPGFSYTGQRVSDEEFTEIWTARVKHSKRIAPWMLAGLRRGIGVHTTTLPVKYRQAVEFLVRKRHVRVVFATSTLALGIHVPCRSVVFCGDGVELSAMNYRQMAGRAGRRGMDKLGHVVHYGVSVARWKQFHSTPVGEIHGEHSLSPWLLLRCAQLTRGLKVNRDVREASDAVKRVLLHPLLPQEGMPFWIAFGMEYLAQNQWCDIKGVPTATSLLLTHIRDDPAGAATFAHVLQCGALQRAHTRASTVREKEYVVLLLLAHCFGRRPAVLPPSQECAILPPLPLSLAQAIHHHQQHAMNIAVQAVLSMHPERWDGLPHPQEHVPYTTGSLVDSLQLVHSSIALHGSTLSGVGDHFLHPEELAESVSVSVDPSCVLALSDCGALNGYGLAMWLGVQALERQCGIPARESYAVMTSFIQTVMDAETVLGMLHLEDLESTVQRIRIILQQTKAKAFAGTNIVA